MSICAGDTILVGDRSRARLVLLVSGETFVIDQNSEFVVQRADNTGSLIRILRGALLFFTRGLRTLEVQTSFVNASVEGTEFLVRVQDDRTRITVFEGAVRATNPQGAALIRPNQFSEVLAGQAPVARDIQVNVRPRDAVQWALYYEPILPGESLAQLEQVAPADRNATFYIRRAGQLLAVGRVEEARADIDQAIALDANNSDAYALRTVIDVALNDPTSAQRDGREAVARNPGSASARMALSYALQSTFRLEAAKDELESAVRSEPTNGRAWARLAELWLSLGYQGRSLSAARRAASLSPDLARPQTVLGFALLAQIKLSEARSTFEKAITLESDDPLARFGLGLARIRHGDLDRGRGDLEIAVALNPDSSLLRSYLGKAYYEEKRSNLAGRQLDLAKRLDHLDPTPLFGSSPKSVVTV